MTDENAPAEPLTDNEGMTFRRLSDALTGGNAGTWDELFDAVETLAAQHATQQAALRDLVTKWRDAAVWEHDGMANVQSGQTFDQCASELAQLLGEPGDQ